MCGACELSNRVGGREGEGMVGGGGGIIRVKSSTP